MPPSKMDEYQAIWFSVACLERLMNPLATVDSILATNLVPNIYSLHQRLNIPPKYLSSHYAQLKQYIHEAFRAFHQTHPTTRLVSDVRHTGATDDEVITYLHGLFSNNASISFSGVHFAIFRGVALGDKQWFAYPDMASRHGFVEWVAKSIYMLPSQASL